MEFFYPIGEDPENEPFFKLLPNQYKFAAKIFYPFIEMSDEWKADAQSNQPLSNTDILRYGKPLSWEAMGKKCGLTIPEISIAVTACIVGKAGRKTYQRPDLVQKLEESLPENILIPNEDEVSPLIIHDILSVLASKGSKKMKYENLYGEKGTHTIKDMDLETILSLCHIPITICDEDEDMMFTCFFDEVAANFLATEDCRAELVEAGLEGIIFGEETPLVWEGGPYTLLK